jgi:hypothetical protein
MHPFALRHPECGNIAFFMEYEAKENEPVYLQFVHYSDPEKQVMGPVPKCGHCDGYLPSGWAMPMSGGFLPSREFVAHVERLR